ncbi:hypothetical protein Sgou_51290 [Streptomyces gougerotii]|uniref:Uncharacterized protein n=1 Tax=Streptomyces gougerotii TaxID=53448 RepID=A0ABQ1DD29_9ACTN|nr:hypothetical protein Sgou_51290 [Streptomyces gougerotii]
MAVWPTTGTKPSAKSSTPQIAARTRMRRLSRVETHRSYQKGAARVGDVAVHGGVDAFGDRFVEGGIRRAG